MYNGNQVEIYVIDHIIFLTISFKLVPYMLNIAETAKVISMTTQTASLTKN